MVADGDAVAFQATLCGFKSRPSLVGVYMVVVAMCAGAVASMGFNFNSRLDRVNNTKKALPISDKKCGPLDGPTENTTITVEVSAHRRFLLSKDDLENFKLLSQMV